MLARVRRHLGALADRIARLVNVEPSWASMWDDETAEEFDARQARDWGKP